MRESKINMYADKSDIKELNSKIDSVKDYVNDGFLKLTKETTRLGTELEQWMSVHKILEQRASEKGLAHYVAWFGFLTAVGAIILEIIKR